MSSQVYVIADPHFGHRKVAELRGFTGITEHDAELVRRWNATVSGQDVVYILGDVSMHARLGWGNLTALNGTKKLAMGNHDKGEAGLYADVCSKVGAYFEFDNCLLSHIPVHPSQFGRYRLNVHGHTHTHSLDDPRYVCVSAEQTDLRPVLLRDVIARADEQARGAACKF